MSGGQKKSRICVPIPAYVMAIIGEADIRQTIANSFIAISKRQSIGEITLSPDTYFH